MLKELEETNHIIVWEPLEKATLKYTNGELLKMTSADKRIFEDDRLNQWVKFSEDIEKKRNEILKG
jgi:hypothetical protein